MGQAATTRATEQDGELRRLTRPLRIQGTPTDFCAAFVIGHIPENLGVAALGRYLRYKRRPRRSDARPSMGPTLTYGRMDRVSRSTVA
jgi:hypothetical protein